MPQLPAEAFQQPSSDRQQLDGQPAGERHRLCTWTGRAARVVTAGACGRCGTGRYLISSR